MIDREEMYERMVTGDDSQALLAIGVVLLDLRDLLQPISEAALVSKQMQELVLEKMRNDPPFPRSDA